MRNTDMENGNTIITEENEPTNKLRDCWSDQPKTTKKWVYCTIGFVVTVIICLVVYFSLFYDKTVICKSPECEATVTKLRSFMDERYEPCDDFYRFACGSFLQNRTAEDPYSLQTAGAMIQEEIQSDINEMLEEPLDPEDWPSVNLAKRFYKACMNEPAIEKVGLKPVYQIFERMGGWPIVEGDYWNPDNFGWAQAIKNLRAFGAEFEFFFNVTVEIDKEHPQKYILGIHDKFYGPSRILPETRKSFLAYMVDVASQFDVKVTHLREELDRVVDFILELGKISESGIKQNKTNLYNVYSLTQLRNEYGSIPWVDFLHGIVRNAKGLRPEDIINVAEPVYLRKLETLLSRTEKRVIANFMGWQIVQSLINYLPSRILNKAHDFLAKISEGRYVRRPRWVACVEATRSRLSASVNIGYIERYLDDETKYRVLDLIKSVRDQFKKNLLNMKWLDEETRRSIMSMLVTSAVKIDSDVFDVIMDNAIYDKVRIEEDKLLKAILQLDLINWDIYYSKLWQPVRDEWTKSPDFINGVKVVYSASENALKFPLALFRDIYYNKDRPDYVNYGLLGTMLAHHISHIFVEARGANVAESKAAQERLLNWWSPLSLNKYIEKLECITNHYAKHQLRKAGNMTSHTLITRDEDVADLGGIKVAYYAYLDKEWKHGKDPLLAGLKYSSKQLFWISSALQFCSKNMGAPNGVYLDRHSPDEFRVNGPMQNLDEFAHDFGCPRGSYMNPTEKCYIW